MELIIKFTDQSSSFAYGVEFGRLLEKIERGDEVIKNNGFPIREENVELLKTTCKYYDYISCFTATAYDGWVYFMAIKKTISNN